MAQTELLTQPAIELPAVSSPASPTRKALRRFRRHRLAMFGVVVIVVLVIAALLGDRDAAIKPNLKNTNKAPSLEHLLGTDRTGRDVFARTLVGGRVSLSVGLVAVLFSTVIGTTLGALAGFYRGWVDQVIMRVVDMVMSFPVIVLLLCVVAIVGPGIFKIMVMIGLLTWTTPCRIMRAQFLSLREKEYVEAARCLGMPNFDIARKHIMPNAIAPLLVYASFGVATAVLLEAGLSYLGLGVQPPTPSWGNMLNTARSISTMERTSWQWIPPAITTVMFVLAVNFVGDGIRDALDPRTLFEK
ncbi:MAG: oligopeptide ABC transporter permease [Kouleothrix sp.]|jgi:peptide/nickel transport system permease protein|nr:ABC transporter permease [Kouleothrix sp.]